MLSGLHPTRGFDPLVRASVLNALTIIVALSDHDICVASFSGAYSFHVSRDRPLCLGLTALSLGTDQFEIVSEQAMARNRSPVGCAGKGANDTCTNKDREVKAILRVPFRCYNRKVSVRAGNTQTTSTYSNLHWWLEDPHTRVQ